MKVRLVKNPDKDETLTLSAAITASNDLHRAKDIEKNAAARAGGGKTAYALGRRLSAAWTAFRAPPARPS